MSKKILLLLFMLVISAVVFGESPFDIGSTDSDAAPLSSGNAEKADNSPLQMAHDSYSEGLRQKDEGDFLNALEFLSNAWQMFRDAGEHKAAAQTEKEIRLVRKRIVLMHKEALALLKMAADQRKNKKNDEASKNYARGLELLRDYHSYVVRYEPEKAPKIVEQIASLEKMVRLDEINRALQREYNVELNSKGGAEWNEVYAQAVYDTMGTLPPEFIRYTERVVRAGPVKGVNPDFDAYVYYREEPEAKVLPLHKDVYMADGIVRRKEAWTLALEWRLRQETGDRRRLATEEEILQDAVLQFKRALVHEMTHTLQNFNHELVSEWQSRFWPDEQVKDGVPTSYGRANPREDMAESVAEYWLGGRVEKRDLKTGYDAKKIKLHGVKDYALVDVFVSANGTILDMERYRFIKEKIMAGKEYLPK